MIRGTGPQPETGQPRRRRIPPLATSRPTADYWPRWAAQPSGSPKWAPRA